MKSNTDLRSSIKVLMTLYVMLEQDYEALKYYSDYLAEDSLKNKNNVKNKDEIIDFAIQESLWFQIIIKSCSFIDEWDGILAIRTEPEYAIRLKKLKKIVSPARRAIGFWPELKKFRNEITAHNFRGKNKVVTIDNIREYKCPQTVAELGYLIAFLESMVRIIRINFPKELNYILNHAHNNIITSQSYKVDKELEIDRKIKDLEILQKEVEVEITELINESRS